MIEQPACLICHTNQAKLALLALTFDAFTVGGISQLLYVPRVFWQMTRVVRKEELGVVDIVVQKIFAGQLAFAGCTAALR